MTGAGTDERALPRDEIWQCRRRRRASSCVRSMTVTHPKFTLYRSNYQKEKERGSKSEQPRDSWISNTAMVDFFDDRSWQSLEERWREKNKTNCVYRSVLFGRKIGERTMKISISPSLSVSIRGSENKEVCMKKIFDSDDDWNCDPPEHLSLSGAFSFLHAIVYQINK